MLSGEQIDVCTLFLDDLSLAHLRTTLAISPSIAVAGESALASSSTPPLPHSTFLLRSRSVLVSLSSVSPLHLHVSLPRASSEECLSWWWQASLRANEAQQRRGFRQGWASAGTGVYRRSVTVGPWRFQRAACYTPAKPGQHLTPCT